ncbi:ABC transporter substrate-binding protein [Shewanella sp. UCD-KL12]|uniref:substrate-binding periplasmic protein n=1 Tax=Shewanella sp. UCD-KL12 TaxID=1917163 RepID=UPI002116E16F|nr:transporter substrate-binding domain-containing protein [Shewanella sp. UCD-KL12]
MKIIAVMLLCVVSITSLAISLNTSAHSALPHGSAMIAMSQHDSEPVIDARAKSTSNNPSSSKLHIAIVEYPPYEFSYIDQDGKLQFDGVSVTLVKEVFRRLNQTFELQTLPWSRALKLLKEGKIDGLFEVLSRPERLAYADFTQEVLMQEVVMLFVTEDSEITFTGELSSLADYQFGMRKDFSYGPYFDTAVEQKVIKHVTADVESTPLLLKLCTGDIDILVAEKDTIHYVEKEVKALQSSSLRRCKNIKRLEQAVQSTPTYMAFSKQSDIKHVRDRFDQVLRQMKQDGSYQKIIDEWKRANLDK